MTEPQDLPFDRELFLTPFKLSCTSISLTFLLPPQYLLPTAISPAQPSLLSWRYQVPLISSAMSPAHHQWIWELVSPMTSPPAPAQYFENTWPKSLSRRNRSCAMSLIHSQTYHDHCARSLCHHTAPSHGSNPPVLSFFHPVFLICNHLTLHLHNWHLSFRSWTALNSCAAPEPSVELLPAATAACLSFLALFFIKTHNSNNTTKTKLCSRQALWSSSSFNSASGHLEPLLPSPSPLCIFPLTASSAVLFSTSFTRGKSHHVSNTQQKQS